MKKKFTGKPSAEQPSPAPKVPAPWNPFTKFMADDTQAAVSSTTEQYQVQGTQQPEKAKETFSSMFNRDQTTIEGTNAVKGPQKLPESITQVKVGEAAMSEEAKTAALERYQAMLESGGADPFTMFMSTENFGALDAVVELPPARTHSISEDAVLIARPAPQELHSLSSDALVAAGRPGVSHTLAHDKVINAIPSTSGGHRLSVDAMVPVRTAAPGHYLDEDPTVSSPQNLFPHELLEDVRVLRPKSPQAHSLDLDKKLAMLHKQIQPHSLHSDTVLPAPIARAAHALDSDQRVISGTVAQGSHDIVHDKMVASRAGARGNHDIVQDVRIVSPGSGQVREPHSIDEDEVIKETTLFRKSPHPEAMMMPSNWVSPASGGENQVNSPMASLNASLQSAKQALGELNQAVGFSEAGKENTASGM